MSGPLFTEDRLNTSGSDQEMCDQEVTTLTQDRTPTRTPVHNAPSWTGSIATVDYSTQGDLDQPAHSPMGVIGNQSNSIDNTRNFYFQMALEEGYWTSPSPRGNHSSWIMDTQCTKFSLRIWNLSWKPAHTSSIGSPVSSMQSTVMVAIKWLPHP